MTAKQYLNEYQNLNKEIDAMVSEKLRLRQLTESISGSYEGTDGDGGKHTAGSARFESTIGKLTEVEKDINAKIDILILRRTRIETIINAVEDAVLRTILKDNYLNNFTFERIAVNMNYSCRQVLRLHGQALNEITKSINTLY